MSEPDNETIQDAILRHIDNELVEGRLQLAGMLAELHGQYTPGHSAWNIIY